MHYITGKLNILFNVNTEMPGKIHWDCIFYVFVSLDKIKTISILTVAHINSGSRQEIYSQF